MISPENFIFDRIAKELRNLYEGITVTGEYVTNSTKFPVVTFDEADNSVYQKMRTDKIENAVQLTYDINVYSNKVGYKKLEAKTIMATIDGMMADLGFTRTMCMPVKNLQDASIYRLSARYYGVCDTTGRIFTN